MKFQTDMNERERARYARAMRIVAKHANDTAEALEKSDDVRLLIDFIAFNLSISMLKELQQIVKAAATNFTAKKESEEWPSIIPPPRI